MIHENFNSKEHGFAGHLAEPDGSSDKAVIVVMGGEQSLLPGIKFAERFADYGITGLSVSFSERRDYRIHRIRFRSICLFRQLNICGRKSTLTA